MTNLRVNLPLASPSAFQSGLSAWRILSGFPYYKLIEEEGFAKVVVSTYLLF